MDFELDMICKFYGIVTSEALRSASPITIRNVHSACIVYKTFKRFKNKTKYLLHSYYSVSVIIKSVLTLYFLK
ncbi:hypothetical protein Bhyg_10368 [Pseudolycoriella hygida]|uniref:Uncharacterized protein n=1 Tax=Pseudolycoriella hygida TaxID=35572 RepID=A0A9Q0RYP0_9DIPT|nr:hypothetical protein Bhyg_10368 [Pseudolycoriella hygida]